MTPTLFTYHEIEHANPMNIASSPIQEQKQIFSDHFPYAAYMYMGLQGGARYLGNENGVLLGSRFTQVDQLKPRLRILSDKIINQIKTLGFNVDSQGNFYSLATGTLFNLILDRNKEEIIVAFMGLNKHSRIEVPEEEQEILRKNSYTFARRDFFGDRTAAVEQVHALGEILIEETKDQSGYKKQFKPVFIGHSHGGGLAQAGALAHGIKGVTFSPRPIGQGTIDLIGLDNIRENQSKISTFCIRGDWLSEADSSFNVCARAALFFSGRSDPRSFGIPYELPQTEGSNYHSSFYSSFLLLRKNFS